ncbi:MAG: peroxiredoxin [Thaumarchaeota archaeon]|nr:peroxiredoxin [Nitrososphaerota archaeon]
MNQGDNAPDFELEANTGEKIRLYSYIGKKEIILFFYIKDNTPGCTAEVKGVKENYQKISDKYEVFGINHDSMKSHVDFCNKHDLPFRILSDPGKKVASMYDAKGALGAYTKRITYLIGLDGKIKEIVHGMSASNHIELIQRLAQLKI